MHSLFSCPQIHTRYEAQAPQGYLYSRLAQRFWPQGAGAGDARSIPCAPCVLIVLSARHLHRTSSQPPSDLLHPASADVSASFASSKKMSLFLPQGVNPIVSTGFIVFSSPVRMHASRFFRKKEALRGYLWVRAPIPSWGFSPSSLSISEGSCHCPRHQDIFHRIYQ